MKTFRDSNEQAKDKGGSEANTQAKLYMKEYEKIDDFSIEV